MELDTRMLFLFLFCVGLFSDGINIHLCLGLGLGLLLGTGPSAGAERAALEQTSGLLGAVKLEEAPLLGSQFLCDGSGIFGGREESGRNTVADFGEAGLQKGQQSGRIKLSLGVTVFHDDDVSDTEDMALVALVADLSLGAECARNADRGSVTHLCQNGEEIPSHDLGDTGQEHLASGGGVQVLGTDNDFLKEINVRKDYLIHLGGGLGLKLSLSLSVSGTAGGDTGGESGGDTNSTVGIGNDGGADNGGGRNGNGGRSGNGKN